MRAPQFTDRMTGLCFATILQCLSSTWRIDTERLEILDWLSKGNRRHVLAFWHRDYITLFRLFRHRPTIAITNQSRRGQVIAEICRRSGMQAMQVRGNEGTKKLLSSLEFVANQGLGVAIAVDGPLGPPQKVKRVVLRLAAKLECSIVPISVATKFKYVFSTRWDRLEIPCPFSRICYVVGNPIDVTNTSSRTELHDLSNLLNQSIDRGTELARQRLCQSFNTGYSSAAER